MVIEKKSLLVFPLLFAATTSKMFPSWEPESKDVLCAKFVYFYNPKCFDGYVDSLERQLPGLRGPRRLQVACYNLMRALGGCLKFFNDKCSVDLLGTGEAAFTPATLAGPARAALTSYRESWIARGGPNFDLNINKCTAYGGLCEHPKQLQYCQLGSATLVRTPKAGLLIILVISIHSYFEFSRVSV